MTTDRLWYYIIVATAGHDTTSFALSGGMEQLVRDPDQLAVLRDDPALVNNGRRRDDPLDVAGPPLHALRASRRRQYGGVDIPAGGRVLLCRTRRPTATRTFSSTLITSTSRRSDVDKLLSLRRRRPLLPRRSIRAPRAAHHARQAEPSSSITSSSPARRSTATRSSCPASSTSRSLTRFGRFQRLWFWLRNWSLASQCHNQNPGARILVMELVAGKPMS